MPALTKNMLIMLKIMPALPTPTRESSHLFAPHSTTLNDSKDLFDILTLINADINSFSESISSTFYNAQWRSLKSQCRLFICKKARKTLWKSSLE